MAQVWCAAIKSDAKKHRTSKDPRAKSMETLGLFRASFRSWVKSGVAQTQGENRSSDSVQNGEL
jgi:hypothetical protein